MCGIFCSVYKNDKCNNLHCENQEVCCLHIPCVKMKETLVQRGPDVTQEVDTKLSGDWSGRLVGSVLWTQGSRPTSQPLQDEDGNFLLWNGDILHGPLESSDQCDSEVVFERFKSSPLNAVVDISGPYAFVFWHNSSRQLWFGRDVFGRQSILWSVSPNHLTLSSTAHKNTDFTEVPALGVFMMDLSSSPQVDIQFFPWAHLTTSFSSMSDVPVVVRETLVHSVVGDGSSRLSWLDKEPVEEELIEYTGRSSLEDLLRDSTLSTRVDSLLSVLSSAVGCRVDKQPGVCKNCVRTCSHCSVAVLFSGGLDSTVLALLADRFVPSDHPIDLYNVAFQQPSGSFDVPDRVTGCASLDELKTIAPNRLWNFVKYDLRQVDVCREELASLRSQTIADLIHPLASVLDDSLGCALWFAARGQGSLNGLPYTSPARVVLLGLGADEQLGGYTRHRNTLRHSGQWAALGHELAVDTDNIGRRNLGRDNRVVSAHGRQPRTPFLDERVVAYINSLPPWHRCLPTSDRPPGLGDKLLLRLVAWRLGLRAAANLPKRALQFGSRIANRKEKGDHISQRL